jgi:hypothetical protein
MIELHGAISEKAEYTFFNQIYGNSTAIALSSVLKTTGYYIQVILTTLDQNLKKKTKENKLQSTRNNLHNTPKKSFLNNSLDAIITCAHCQQGRDFSRST